MTQASNGPRSDDSQGGPAKVGQTLQQARLAAHIEVNKICADLRISPQALEALEQGNYHQLSGDPYIRALLGSMSRYLGLDPAAIVREYNQEIGAAPAEVAAAPYTDKAHTHTTTHKQIFIAIVLGLFVLLFLLIGRLNRGDSSAPAPASLPAASDSLALPGDSTPESKALVPDPAAPPDSTIKDSAQVKPAAPGVSTSNAPAAPATTAPAGTPAAPASATPAAPVGVQGPQPAGSPADTAGMTVAIIKPLVDSVGVRVSRFGKEDVATLLRLGKQMQVSHPDTIVVYTSKRGTVEVTVGGTTVTPNRKRFKIYGKTVKAF